MNTKSAKIPPYLLSAAEEISAEERTNQKLNSDTREVAKMTAELKELITEKRSVNSLRNITSNTKTEDLTKKKDAKAIFTLTTSELRNMWKENANAELVNVDMDVVTKLIGITN